MFGCLALVPSTRCCVRASRGQDREWVATAVEFSPARLRFLVLFSSYLRLEVRELAGWE